MLLPNPSACLAVSVLTALFWQLGCLEASGILAEGRQVWRRAILGSKGMCSLYAMQQHMQINDIQCRKY